MQPISSQATPSLSDLSFGVRASASAVTRAGGWAIDASAREEEIANRYRYRDATRDRMMERTNAGVRTLGGGLGYTLKSSVTAPGAVRVVVVHSASTDTPANRNDCIWTKGHKSC